LSRADAAPDTRASSGVSKVLENLGLNTRTWDDSERKPFPRHGAEALLWAVFIDGIETYCRAVLIQATQSLDFREAECWIFSRHLDGGVTAFPNLCELFGVDPRRLRRGLLRFRENPQVDVMALLHHDAA
jgi:hypothetical protein